MKTFIKTYAINLRHRIDRKTNILKQFEGKSEFDFKIIEAFEHNIGVIGLWQSIASILQSNNFEDDEFIMR